VGGPAELVWESMKVLRWEGRTKREQREDGEPQVFPESAKGDEGGVPYSQ
jgi:hypothetical protein